MSIPSYFYSLGSSVIGSVSAALSGKARPIGRDLGMDPLTHDLALIAGDLTLVADREAIRQEADIRFNFLLGEWFLDVTRGLPWFQKILVKSPDLTAIRAIFTDEALEIAGVHSLLKMVLNLNRSTRKLKVEWSADTDLGELNATTNVRQ